MKQEDLVVESRWDHFFALMEWANEQPTEEVQRQAKECRAEEHLAAFMQRMRIR